MKYSLVACAVIDAVTSSLECWLRFQLAAGVEHIHLYVRQMGATLPESWSAEFGAQRLSLHPWPAPLSQATAYLHCSRLQQGRADWLLCQRVDVYLSTVSGQPLVAELDGFAAEHGAICLQPRWQVALPQIVQDVPADPLTLAGRVSIKPLAPGQPHAFRPELLYLLRPLAVQRCEPDLQLAEGWICVNERGQPWAPEPELSSSRERFLADSHPLGLPAAWPSQSAGRWPPAGRRLSEVLQPMPASKGEVAIQVEPERTAVMALCVLLAAGRSGLRALATGDMPLGVLQALLAAGYQLDLIEAVPARVRALRQQFAGCEQVRLAATALDGLQLDLDYALVIVNQGDAYACNRLDGDPCGARLGASLQARLVADGLMLVLDAGAGVGALAKGWPISEMRVLPDWSSSQAIAMVEHLELLRHEFAVTAELENCPGERLTLLGPVPAGVRALQGMQVIAGSIPLMRRVHAWRRDAGAAGWRRELGFFAPLDEVQGLLGDDIQPQLRLAVDAAVAPRLLPQMRRAAASGDLASFIDLLRRWSGRLSAAADAEGRLPGPWFDALPAQVRLAADGSLDFEAGEWLHRQPVDLKLVRYLGLWQLATAPGFERILPAAAAMDRVRWLDRLLQHDSDELWLEQTGKIHQLTGSWPLDPAAAALGGYGRQLGDLRLTAPVIARLRQRLEAGGGLPRLAVLLWETGDTVNSTAVQLSRRSIAALDYPLPVSCLQVTPGLSQAQLLAQLQQDGADWVFMLEAGDGLDPAAAWIVAERVSTLEGIKACYLDEDRDHQGQRVEPIFKPDLNLDLLRGYPYTGRGMVFQRAGLVELGGLLPALGVAAPSDMLFRCIERYGLAAVAHIAEALYSGGSSFDQWLRRDDLCRLWPELVASHLQRLGIAHTLSPGPLAGSVRVHYLHVTQPLVSIIIPTRNQLHLLSALMDSLLEHTAYPRYEILIVDNGSDDADACRYLDGLEQLASEQIRVLRYRQPFNYSAMNNLAEAEARGDYLLLLNNDTQMFDPGWLDAMLHHAQRPEVGIVGAKLFYPNGLIQHAGVIMGLDESAGHPFAGLPASASGYMQRLVFDQNYTAVTAACLLIRREVYRQLGGLDAQDLAVSFNDVDLCLRVTQAGYLVVWTPHAQLMHHGSVSQTQLDIEQQSAKLMRFRRERETMFQRWLPYMAADPAYNRNLSLQGPAFELDPYRHIAWQPFVQRPLPRMVCHPADDAGSGHYRVRQPFIALRNAGWLDGAITENLLSPILLERFETDAIILQRQHTDAQREAMQRYLKYSQAFKVYELDDYMFNLPMKSAHRSEMPKDLRRQLRQAVAMTDRVVVSTQMLAEQCGGLHDDIRVVLNRLPTDWWATVRAQRRVGPRPRVGWGGGISHTGDLELIADVVRELATEVDWVFFGMCPDKLRPYIKEFHGGVPIEQYPARLASLNLDLALAPLEDNLFNHCKSNLRLLEYGACGFPVVCSDLITYRCDLPVTRVKNRFKDWVAAIRMHLADLDATAAMGDRLRDAVMRDWMLAGENLLDWQQAWLP